MQKSDRVQLHFVVLELGCASGNGRGVQLVAQLLVQKKKARDALKFDLCPLVQAVSTAKSMFGWLPNCLLKKKGPFAVWVLA
jgi:hypothetical protein